MRDGFRFAGSRSRDDEKRAFGMQRGFLLPLIEVVEKGHAQTISQHGLTKP
jgi:hypothetical protein